MKKLAVVLIFALFVSSALADDDVTDIPVDADATEGSSDDVAVTDETIASSVENSESTGSVTDTVQDSDSTVTETIEENPEPSSEATENDQEPSASGSNDEDSESTNDATESEQSSNPSVDNGSYVSGTTEQSEGEPQDESNATTEDDGSNTVEGSEDNGDSSTQSNDESTSNPVELPSSPSPPSPPPFSCAESGVGRFPQPGNCHEYNYCWDSVHEHVTFTCKEKVFDPDTKLCANNWALCESTPKCDADRQVLANPDDNLSFFVCRLHPDPLNPAWIVQKEKCHGDRVFDPELGYCKELESDSSSSSSSSSSESDESKEKFECTAAGIYIDINDETKFIECTLKSVAKGKFKLHHLKCPKNHVFSLEDKLCIPV